MRKNHIGNLHDTLGDALDSFVIILQSSEVLTFLSSPFVNEQWTF